MFIVVGLLWEIMKRDVSSIFKFIEEREVAPMIDETKVTLRIRMKTEFLSRIVFKNMNLLEYGEIMRRM